MNASAMEQKTHQSTIDHRRSFLRGVYSAFEDAVSAANGDDDSESKDLVLRELALRFFGGDSEDFVSGEDWAKNKRFFEALSSGLVRGDIVLRDQKDISLVLPLIIRNFEKIPDIVEHYTMTGELLDLVLLSDALMYEFFRIEGNGFLDNSEYMSLHLEVLVSMKRLYDFDMLSADNRDLPLEIRTQFSGFNEVEMTDDEREWMNAL